MIIGKYSVLFSNALRYWHALYTLKIMIRNYLAIARRNLLRKRGFTAINIAGLATGLCCFLLISLYVIDELSYDRFHKKADRIYRIHLDMRMGGVDRTMPNSPDAMGGLLKKDYPEIEQYTRIYTHNGSRLVKKGNEFITETRAANADSTFFDVFSFHVIEGNGNTALAEPNTVVISASLAKKYFGMLQAVGKTLEVQEGDGVVPYRVTAVIEDMPENSHFRYDLLFSMSSLHYDWGQVGSHNFYTYLVLGKHVRPATVEKKFPEYVRKYLLPHIQERMHVTTMEEFINAGNKVNYWLMPLTRIHLYSNLEEELRPPGSIQYVYIFSAVALFILLIACVNFMNLTTARSANRAREVAIRKVLGTERKDLIFQFLTESILIVLLSMLLAVALAAVVLPMFNELTGKLIGVKAFLSPYILPVLIILPFVVGLLAGSYPAFFLSAFRPIETLKGKFKLNSKSGGLRNVLVVFQFFTSIVLIIGTLVVYRQLHYIQSKNIGFNKDQVLIINGTWALGNKADAFKDRVVKLSGVSSGTLSSSLPVSNTDRSNTVISTEAVVTAKSSINIQTWRIDYDYIGTLGMKIIKGRNFSRDFGSDSSAVIINETAAKLWGLDDPVGKTIYQWQDTKTIPRTIIGVVKNFNYESLREKVGPLCFFLDRSTGLAAFRVNTTRLNDLVNEVGELWKSIAPEVPFSYRFLDESFDAMYDAERRVGRIALLFSGLAIFIACLGIFGLAAYIAEQRIKEIGVRKVLGASVESIVALLSKDFLRLVLIAFLIAAPLGWWIMNKWLQSFAYRISLSWWLFVLAGVIAMMIALITVSFQSVKAALTNPLKSLRSE